MAIGFTTSTEHLEIVTRSGTLGFINGDWRWAKFADNTEMVVEVELIPNNSSIQFAIDFLENQQSSIDKLNPEP